jgi:hypothetical protein
MRGCSGFSGNELLQNQEKTTGLLQPNQFFNGCGTKSPDSEIRLDGHHCHWHDFNKV